MTSTRTGMTLAGLRALKQASGKFSVLTCYDARIAAIMEKVGVEVLLVGDTAAEVVLGLETTRAISPEVLLNLTAAVRRGAPNGLIMADLPYACAREGLARTVDWTKRFYAEPPTDAVKIEVTDADAPLVEALADAGVPVVAHLGLLPQSIEPATGYRGQGKTAEAAEALIASARRMENAGAAMLLLEAVASEVAREITRQTPLPVIGCVAGPHCDGTVVVLHDMIGLGGGHPPRAVKQYLDLSSILAGAFQEYVNDIHEGRFPSEDDSIHMKPGEYAKLLARCRGV